MKISIEEMLNDAEFPEGIAWNRRCFHANEIIVREGEVGRTLFIVEEGIVRVTIQVQVGAQKNLKPGISDLGKDDIFGEVCLYKSHVRNATVTAVTDGRLLEVDGERLSIYLDAHPIQGYLFYKSLFEVLLERVNCGNHRIEYLLAWGLKVHDIAKHL
ncbi:CarD family transcriptional regulator [Candidatus Methylobacter favarea]|uniref:CarD family transcriptional regulator n=1 Tax=Candidatus Methylobacter favarea TaxID=2707345 RepID=A0A8S0WYB5_9GAMM|nr:cyclic nucleotide-binding domain-containing protein [Candidatus Methylobacter favarea]CAA9889503.1 CarD family transcriptional regulator [Candidatus Methylobacter favarea]